MSTIKKSRFKSNFTQIDNRVVQHTEMSAKAKGVFCYLQSLPDDWVIKKTELENHFSDGRRSIDNAFKELENYGLMASFEQIRNNGSFSEKQYLIYPTFPEYLPELENHRCTETPSADVQNVQPPMYEMYNDRCTKRTTTNKQQINNTNKEKYKKENPDSDAQSELPENGKKEKEENQSLNINHENSEPGKEIDLFGNKTEASKSNITSLKEDYIRIFNKITKRYRENARGIKKIDRKTEKNLRELNEYTWEEIEHSINQMYLSDFHKENNYKYLTPEFCSRVDKINRYINENKKSKVKNEKFYTGFGEPIINRNKAK